MSSSSTQGSQPVHGTVTVDAITNPVTVTGTVAIDTTGLATSAAQATGNTSLSSILTALSDILTELGQKLEAGQSVVVSSAPTTAVTGTFFQATQPVSATGLPLPSGASTEATLSTLNGKVTACNTGAVVVSSAPTTAVTGTFWQATQPISGAVTDSGSGKTLKSAVVSLSSTGTVVNAVVGKRIKVYGIKLVVSAALVVNFRSGGSTALEGTQSLGINGGYAEAVNPPAFLFGTTAGESLDLVITGVGTIAGRVSYWDDDAA